MMFGDRFYSVAELADVTGYHRDSIYRAIDSGGLAAAKPRGKWLIAGAAINAWLHAGVRPHRRTTSNRRVGVSVGAGPRAQRRFGARARRGCASTHERACGRILP
jgi:excisionase family DNA binding protein